MNRELAGVVAAMAITGGAMAQDAVQWRIEDGGNGHWYMVEINPDLTWNLARTTALARGGSLATVTAPTENQFILNLALATTGAFVATDFGPFLGGFQTADSSGTIHEPGGSWTWVSGEAWAFTNWLSTEPNDFDCISNAAPENHLQLYRNGRWNDAADSPTECGSRLCVSYVIEWSADCNSDGIVDFGQILDGTLLDIDQDNIPDCCEQGLVCGCPSDIVKDGAVNGVDLAAVINAWGTDGGKLPRSDVDGNGVVDGADLAQVLGAWGPCN
ncbi:MAG: hypothetical protein RLZZ116_272 [Planctomycetota bacterium]